MPRASLSYHPETLDGYAEVLHRQACEAQPGTERCAELIGMVEGLEGQNIGILLADMCGERTRAAMMRGFEAGQTARKVFVLATPKAE